MVAVYLEMMRLCEVNSAVRGVDASNALYVKWMTQVLRRLDLEHWVDHSACFCGDLVDDLAPTVILGCCGHFVHSYCLAMEIMKKETWQRYRGAARQHHRCHMCQKSVKNVFLLAGNGSRVVAALEIPYGVLRQGVDHLSVEEVYALRKQRIGFAAALKNLQPDLETVEQRLQALRADNTAARRSRDASRRLGIDNDRRDAVEHAHAMCHDLIAAGDPGGAAAAIRADVEELYGYVTDTDPPTDEASQQNIRDMLTRVKGFYRGSARSWLTLAKEVALDSVGRGSAAAGIARARIAEAWEHFRSDPGGVLTGEEQRLLARAHSTYAIVRRERVEQGLPRTVEPRPEQQQQQQRPAGGGDDDDETPRDLDSDNDPPPPANFAAAHQVLVNNLFDNEDSTNNDDPQDDGTNDHPRDGGTNNNHNHEDSSHSDLTISPNTGLVARRRPNEGIDAYGRRIGVRATGLGLQSITDRSRQMAAAAAAGATVRRVLTAQSPASVSLSSSRRGQRAPPARNESGPLPEVDPEFAGMGLQELQRQLRVATEALSHANATQMVGISARIRNLGIAIEAAGYEQHRDDATDMAERIPVYSHLYPEALDGTSTNERYCFEFGCVGFAADTQNLADRLKLALCRLFVPPADNSDYRCI